MTPLDLAALAPLAGVWELQPERALYVRPHEKAQAPFGLAVAPHAHRLRSGRLKASVIYDQVRSVGRLAFGYNAETGAYFSAGIGGYGFAYVLDEFLPGRGWRPVRQAGSEENLGTNTTYSVDVLLKGQSTRLFVNDVMVLEGSLPYPITGDQVGLFAWGAATVRFEHVAVEAEKPQAFVVMQFGEPYDSLYSQVIEPVAKSAGFQVHRADDVYKPGVILQDIVTGLRESDVIVAEITPPNPNVFYEIGYAHAQGKPTILLAERGGGDLPFDIRSYRCIFYDDTIRGKGGVEATLKKHLESILNSD